jgi:hypothetical protein
MTDHDAIRYRLRECWVNPDNLRLSCPIGGVEDFTVHALVLESVEVVEEDRRQGHCRRLIERLCAEPGYDLVIVEAVQNPVLAEALLRWGWECDPGVMDFYRWKESR